MLNNLVAAPLDFDHRRTKASMAKGGSGAAAMLMDCKVLSSI